jgi:hypothetical protein
VPFVSSSQQRFMWANHPQIAARWQAVTKGKLPNHVGGSSESNESNKPGVPRLPRKSAGKRDFGPLSPGPVARLKLSKRASEADAMAEKPPEAHSRGETGKMSLRYHDESRLQGRDVTAAERSR